MGAMWPMGRQAGAGREQHAIFRAWEGAWGGRVGGFWGVLTRGFEVSCADRGIISCEDMCSKVGSETILKRRRTWL